MPGTLNSYVGTDPAAGVEISEVVPAGKYWRLYAVRFTIVTSATVANRGVRLTLDDGTNVFWHADFATNVTASLTEIFAFGREQGVENTALTGFGPSLSLPDLVLGPGYRIKTTTTNLDAGDNYGPPAVLAAQFDSLIDALGGV